jgi:hypothetical protein
VRGCALDSGRLTYFHGRINVEVFICSRVYRNINN